MIVILQLCRPFPHIANDILRQDDRHLDDLLHAQPLLRGLHPRAQANLEEHNVDDQELKEEDRGGGQQHPGFLRRALSLDLLGGGHAPLLDRIDHKDGH